MFNFKETGIKKYDTAFAQCQYYTMLLFFFPRWPVHLWRHCFICSSWQRLLGCWWRVCCSGAKWLQSTWARTDTWSTTISSAGVERLLPFTRPLFHAVFKYGAKYFPALPLFFSPGLPVLIVTITLSSASGKYSADGYCWLSVQNGVIWGFTGPVIFIIMVCGLCPYLLSLTQKDLMLWGKHSLISDVRAIVEIFFRTPKFFT